MGYDTGDHVADEMIRQAENVEAELNTGSTTPIEALLCSTAGTLWLAWSIAEANFPERAGPIHKRYMQTLKTLHAVRTLGLRLQVNIAREQIVANGPLKGRRKPRPTTGGDPNLVPPTPPAPAIEVPDLR